MVSRRRILAVDVCGTLYDTNTTSEFCHFHHRREGNQWRGAILREISRRGSPLWFLLAGIDRVAGIDLHRWFTIRSLLGETREALTRSAAVYAETLEDKRITAVHDLLARLRESDLETVLISNGLDIVIARIAGRLELPWLASRLEFRDNICAGRLADDLHRRKSAALEGWLDLSLQGVDLVVITDNRSDKDIIGAASRAYIVHKGNRRRWMEAYDAKFVQH